MKQSQLHTLITPAKQNEIQCEMIMQGVTCMPEKSLVICYFANPLQGGHQSAFTMCFNLATPDRSTAILHFSATLNT